MEKKAKVALAVTIAGAVSFVLSVLASGLNYRYLESQGAHNLYAPDWIVWWHAVSLLVFLVAGVFLLFQLFFTSRTK